jgi:hypothetical protein
VVRIVCLTGVVYQFSYNLASTTYGREILLKCRYKFGEYRPSLCHAVKCTPIIDVSTRLPCSQLTYMSDMKRSVLKPLSVCLSASRLILKGERKKQTKAVCSAWPIQFLLAYRVRNKSRYSRGKVCCSVNIGHTEL